jgi:hypothetical protein
VPSPPLRGGLVVVRGGGSVPGLDLDECSIARSPLPIQLRPLVSSLQKRPYRLLCRKLAVLGASVSAMGAVAAVSPPPAFGCAFSPLTAHCYAIAEWDLSSSQQGVVYGAGSTQAAGVYVAVGRYWVEAGITVGSDNNSGQYNVVSQNPTLFWADQWSVQPYYVEHFYGPAATNTNYADEIYYIGGNYYYIDIGGNTGYSYPPYALPQYLQAGLELGYQSEYANESGHSAYLGWYNSAEQYSSDWQPPAGADPPSPGVSGGWVVQDWEYSDEVLPYGCNNYTATIRQAQPSTVEMTSTLIASAAKSFATANGDSDPSAITAVRSTRGTALDKLHAGKIDPALSSQSVYVVTMHGEFTAHDAAVPKGHALPTGSDLTMVIDALTGRLTDWMVSDSQPSLGVLGKPTSIG